MTSFAEFADALDREADLAVEIATDIAEGAADQWVVTARHVMGKDTYQLFNRTGVSFVGDGVAELEADTPYAAVHNSGSSRAAGSHFWDEGQAEADRELRRLGAEAMTDVARRVGSGGVANPRSIRPVG